MNVTASLLVGNVIVGCEIRFLFEKRNEVKREANIY
jgi:hypothetical protein